MILRVGVLGPKGTFSERAAVRWCPDGEIVYYDDIEDVITAVGMSEVEVGVVPIENSLVGAVGVTMDLLYRTDVKMVGEVNEPIVHCLLGRSNKVRVIISHPQALAQCRQYIKKRYPGVELRTTGSTSHAAKLAQEFPEMAAIASAECVKLYGLQILERNVQDYGKNVTRFAVVGLHIPGATGQDKTSVVVHIDKDRPGALYEILAEFASRNINLTRIESRPSRKGIGDYNFYIDLEGHISDAKVTEALAGIEIKATRVKVLGSYPKG
jgi:prephenate dehydratase